MRTLEIDGVSFTTGLARRSSTGGTEFLVAKPGDLLDAYLDLAATMAGKNVVELGIFQGGSAALAMLAGDPHRMTVVDICEPVAALDEFIADLHLSDRLRVHYGVDQADRDTLTRIVQEDFGGEPLDLVIDDASHVLDPTRASFEALFPLLRPGGRYLIEDWRWELRQTNNLEKHVQRNPGRFGQRMASRIERGLDPMAATMLARTIDNELPAQPANAEPSTGPRPAPYRPLVTIVSELAAAHAVAPEVVGPVEARQWWITVERGPAPCPSPVDLAGLTGKAHTLLP